MLDSNVVRAHPHAGGARRTTGGQALGRSRGGFSTKLHLRCDSSGRPVTFHLTGGERHDLKGVGPPFERGALRTGRRGCPRWRPEAVIADRAYSATWLLDAFRRKGIVPVIPSRSDQPQNPDFDREVYRDRNLVERLVGNRHPVDRTEPSPGLSHAVPLDQKAARAGSLSRKPCSAATERRRAGTAGRRSGRRWRG